MPPHRDDLFVPRVDIVDEQVRVAVLFLVPPARPGDAVGRAAAVDAHRRAIDDSVDDRFTRRLEVRPHLEVEQCGQLLGATISSSMPASLAFSPLRGPLGPRL